jgi:3-phenylpropionate/cinnamic acid dioxygenase small subunit
MLSQQEISDRMEIQDVLVDYVYKVDESDFDGLRDVFTKDAQLDYTETGAIAGDLETMIDYLKRVMPAVFVRTQHMLGSTKLSIEGDHATATTQCFNPMVMKADGEERYVSVGLWYVDNLVRTSAGWRINKRHERFCYTHNFPESFQAPE